MSTDIAPNCHTSDQTLLHPGGFNHYCSFTGSIKLMVLYSYRRKTSSSSTPCESYNKDIKQNGTLKRINIDWQPKNPLTIMTFRVPEVLAHTLHTTSILKLGYISIKKEYTPNYKLFCNI